MIMYPTIPYRTINNGNWECLVETHIFRFYVLYKYIVHTALVSVSYICQLAPAYLWYLPTLLTSSVPSVYTCRHILFLS